MSAVLSVLSLFPELLGVNGDAENAAVLAARSRWSGHSVDLLRIGLGDAMPTAAPGILVIGSSTDDAIPALLAGLRPARSRLVDWLAAGLPLLAVGTGWEVLGESIELPLGTIDALGVLPGRAVAAPVRVSGDLVVDSRFGRLIGYENHARNYLLPEGAEPLGSVGYGRGNGGDTAAEGLLARNAIATHLHGPVLAKNPGLADHLLRLALGERYDSRTVATGRVDDMARAARNAIAARLELEIE